MSPRLLLLIDGLGALLSAIMLMMLPDLGIPGPTRTALALGAVLMAAYSLTCSLTQRTSPVDLRRIAKANTLYCLTTAALMIVHRATLTRLGLAYFLADIAIISQLIRLESQGGRPHADPGPLL